MLSLDWVLASPGVDVETEIVVCVEGWPAASVVVTTIVEVE